MREDGVRGRGSWRDLWVMGRGFWKRSWPLLFSLCEQLSCPFLIVLIW